MADSPCVAGTLLDKILTFRTITALLEILQDPSLKSGLSTNRSLPLHRSMRSRLHLDGQSDHRSLGALATLLVRNHEIAAVTTRFLTPTMADSSALEIIVCSHEENLDPNTKNLALTAVTNPDTQTSRAPLIFHVNPSHIDPYNPIPYLIETW
jgi:hypothetical protein